MKPARLIALLLIIAIISLIALVGYIGWGINETVQRDKSSVLEESR